MRHRFSGSMQTVVGQLNRVRLDAEAKLEAMARKPVLFLPGQNGTETRRIEVDAGAALASSMATALALLCRTRAAGPWDGLVATLDLDIAASKAAIHVGVAAVTPVDGYASLHELERADHERVKSACLEATP